MPGKLAVLGGLNLCGEEQFPFFKYNEFGIFDVALFKKLSVVGDGRCIAESKHILFGKKTYHPV